MTGRTFTRKAFTLIEVLIAIILAAVLFTLIFRTYVSITQISTRLENEKKLNSEIAYVTETVQNIADSYQIDYAKYNNSLTNTNGRTTTLYLSGKNETGTMLMISGNNLFRIHNNTTTPLISTGNAILALGNFKIIPFNQTATDKFLDIQHPGFRFIASLQAAKYNTGDRIREVEAHMQQFYNLQRVE